LKTRKLLAMLVAVAMIVTMLPVVAFAESEDFSAVAEVLPAEESVTLGVDNFKLTVKVTKADIVPRELEVDHSFEGTLPEFSVYAHEDNPYGTDEVKERFEEYGVTVTYDAEDQKWEIDFGKDVTEMIVAEGEITFYLVLKDVSGKEWGSMYSPTDKNTFKYVINPAVTGKIYADDDEYDVGDKVELNFLFRDQSGFLTKNLGGDYKFYVWAEREKGDISVVDNPVSGDGYTFDDDLLVEIVDADAVVEYKSNYAGEVTFFLGRVKGESKDYDDLTKLDSVTVEFLEDTEGYVLKLEEREKSTVPADGISAHKVTFKLVDKWGVPIKGEQVNFDVDSSRVALNKESAVTNSKGEVEVKATSERAGEYTLTAELDSARNKKVEVDLKFTASAAYDIKVKKGDGALVALDQPYTFEFVVYDLFGRVIKGTDDDDTFDNYVLKYIEKIEVPTCPDKAAIDKRAPYVDADKGVAGHVDRNVVKWASNGNLKVNIPGDHLNKEGEYALRVKLQSGKYATANFKVTEQGEIVDMSIEYNPDYIAYRLIEGTEDDGTTKYYYPDYIEPEVKLIDKDGVEAVTDKDLEFSVSDSKIARIDAAGRVWPANADAEGVVTITVVNTKHRLVASTEVRIGDVGGVGIEFDVPETLLVGEDYTIGMKVIGNDGKKYMKDADYSAVVISKPEGATVEVDVYDDELEVYSDTKGEVKIVVTAREDNESVSGTLTLSFVEEPEKVAEGKVVLTIGSDIGFVDGVPTELDAPAFIEDGRTFVPVRFLAEAVGAEADWEPKDAAVETVYLTWEDMQIIIKIGEEALTVVKDGEEEVVTFDGAARIVNGRTFLPFRAIGEAIGLEVDYGPKDGPVKWVSYN